jgi:hypothetical protein
MTTDTGTPAVNSAQPSSAMLDAIEAQWISRMRAQCRNPRGKRYEDAEIEFFTGAMAGMIAADPSLQVPMRWYIAAIRGQRIVSETRLAGG